MSSVGVSQGTEGWVRGRCTGNTFQSSGFLEDVRLQILDAVWHITFLLYFSCMHVCMLCILRCVCVAMYACSLSVCEHAWLWYQESYSVVSFPLFIESEHQSILVNLELLALQANLLWTSCFYLLQVDLHTHLVSMWILGIQTLAPVSISSAL